MKRYVIEAFDDVVNGTTVVYTTTRLNEVLGQPDRVSLEAVADQSGGTSPTLKVDLEHSNDQRNWAVKSTPIGVTAIPVGATTAIFGADAGTTPTGAFVRLAITLGGTGGPNAHVKIHVCARDDGSNGAGG